MAITTWLPAAHSLAITMAYRDELGSDDALFEFVRDQTRTMYESQAYRILMLAVTPYRLAKLSATRFAKFHRGIELKVESLEERRCSLRLSYGEHLYTRSHMAGMRGAFAAALEASGATHARTELLEHGSTHARIEMRW